MPQQLPSLPSASHASTNVLIDGLVQKHLRPDAQVLDLGCGSGHMTRRISGWFTAKGLDPRAHVTGTDIFPDSFKATEAKFVQMDLTQPLPFADASFDVIVSIEVIEHLTRPYDFLAECRRILKDGGTLVISTPNIYNLQSRLRFLLTGMYALYEPPSVDPANGGRLCGHIMPFGLVYLQYGLRRAGFGHTVLHGDRKKRSSVALYWLLWPFMRLAARWQIKHAERYDAKVFAENHELFGMMDSYDALTARSVVLEATLPARG